MSKPPFSWPTATKEELLALARSSDEETRVTALSYLRDHLAAGTWPEPEQVQVAQQIVNLASHRLPSRVLEELLRCVTASGSLKGIDREPLLDAMKLETFRLPEYLDALSCCGPEGEHVLEEYRTHPDPQVRKKAASLLRPFHTKGQR